MIVAAFGTKGLSGLGDLVAVVEVLYGLFQAYCDAEAEDDSGDVDEEVAPGIGGVMGGDGRLAWGLRNCGDGPGIGRSQFCGIGTASGIGLGRGWLEYTVMASQGAIHVSRSFDSST
jgi:hypothetical protein